MARPFKEAAQPAIGTVFALNTSGSAFTNLYSFTATAGTNSTNSDGAFSRAVLILSGDTLYGTAFQGGGAGNGTVFALSLPAESSVSAQPVIASLSLAGADLALNGISGQSGGMYLCADEHNLTLPLSQWTPVATNVLSASGNFTITVTNTVTPKRLAKFLHSRNAISKVWVRLSLTLPAMEEGPDFCSSRASFAANPSLGRHPPNAILHPRFSQCGSCYQ